MAGTGERELARGMELARQNQSAKFPSVGEGMATLLEGDLNRFFFFFTDGIGFRHYVGVALFFRTMLELLLFLNSFAKNSIS